MFRSSLIFLFLSSLLSSSYAQLVPTPANIVCYQEVVASQGSYQQIDTSLKNWSQKLYNTLNLTGPIELSVGWARVPDRTGFENNCTGPYPNIADLFVHIQTTTAAYDSVSSKLESFIAANRMTSQPNIVCSARSIITYLPGCGKITGGAGLNNGTTSAPTNETTSAPTNGTTSAPTNGTTSAPTNGTTSAPTNGTTSAPTNATGTSNATIAPTLLPSNETTIAPTLLPSNETGSATPSNATSAPTNATLPTEVPSSTSISSNSTNSTLPTELPSSTSISTNTSIETNSSTGSNSTSDIVPGAASQDASATGDVHFNEAYTTKVAVGTLGLVLISSTMSMML